jgi:HK97 family phage portal protein
MKLFGFDFSRKSELSIDQVIARLEAAYATVSGVAVTPENCEESPTVQAIVNAISNAIATLPVHVLKADGVSKERLPNHPVAKLLQRPNEWQTQTEYLLDATSILVRYGRFYAYKARGVTGPIRRLLPLASSNVCLGQGADWDITARVTEPGGGQREVPLSELHYVRGRARDSLTGDSPVMLAREAIALEIAAQKFGSSFFGNGALPGMVFEMAGMQSPEQRDNFLQSFHEKFGKVSGRFKAMLLPQGVKKVDNISVENDKAQFLETRKLQRNIIAGAFGVPPHLVGDLERGTFSNIEEQSRDFAQKVVLPYVRMFETAMERDLLTQEDRNSGVIIRFNMDAALRGSFVEQQTGLKMMREAGALSANEWRGMVNMNPLPDGQGGNEYWQQGPSGQTGPGAGEENADEVS